MTQSKQNGESVVSRHKDAKRALRDKSSLEQAVAEAKRESASAVEALRNSIEVLELAHIRARVEAEETLSVATPELLQSTLAAFATAEERLDLLIRVPEALRDSRWQKDWSVTVDRREHAHRSVVRAGLILARGGSIDELGSVRDEGRAT